MIRTTLGASLAALVAAAASWALAGPIVTRGSAALPDGCSPATVAGLVAVRANRDEERAVYVAVLPNRKLAPREAELRAGIVGADGASSLVKATADCTTTALLSWDGAAQDGAFTSPGPCPKPKGWALSGPTVACAGLPTAWETSDDFIVTFPTRRSGRCGGTAARVRTIALLHALDYGTIPAFGAAFLPKGAFRPYTASVLKPFAGRAAITAFIKKRIAAADGWTATSLLRPVERTKRTSTYAVALVAYASGRPVGAGTARMTLDCASGLIRDWRGPALPLPM